MPGRNNEQSTLRITACKHTSNDESDGLTTKEGQQTIKIRGKGKEEEDGREGNKLEKRMKEEGRKEERKRNGNRKRLTTQEE